MERITGMIIFIASSKPWIEFLLTHIYISITARIGDKTAYLTRTNMQFHQLLKEANSSTEHTRSSTFALSGKSRQVNSCSRNHWINKTLQEEINLITNKALSLRCLKLCTPIDHLVRHDPSAIV